MITQSPESTFLGQGTYGCTYKQKLKCATKAKENGRKKIKGDVMTKIHKDTSTALHEIEISKEILKIPNYNRHFSPILESCTANLAQISKSDIDKCDLIPSDTHNSSLKYFTTKSKYIVGEPFDDHYNKYANIQQSQERLYDKLMYMYAFLLSGIDILNMENIVHCDIKASNIIVDQTDRPIFIDFGLSINIKNMLKNKSYNDIYFFHPLPEDPKIPIDSYEPWCVEIALMSYITELQEQQQENPNIIFTKTDKKHLQSISDRYIDNLKLAGIIFSQTEVEEFKQKKKSNIANFVGRPYSEILKEVTEITYMNWDPYAITIMILKHLEYYITNTSLIRNEHVEMMRSYLFR